MIAFIGIGPLFINLGLAALALGLILVGGEAMDRWENRR